MTVKICDVYNHFSMYIIINNHQVFVCNLHFAVPSRGRGLTVIVEAIRVVVIVIRVLRSVELSVVDGLALARTHRCVSSCIAVKALYSSHGT